MEDEEDGRVDDEPEDGRVDEREDEREDEELRGALYERETWLDERLEE